MRKTTLARTSASLVAAAALATGALVTAPSAQAANSCTVSLSSYTAPGSYDSSPGLLNAMNAVKAAGGGSICVSGKHNLRSAINLDMMGIDKSIRFSGTSPDAAGFIGTTSGPLVVQSDMTYRDPKKPNDAYRGIYQYHLVFEHLYLGKAPGTTGYIFDYRTGAQVNARYTNIKAEHKGTNGGFLLIGGRHQAHGNVWESVRASKAASNPAGLFKVASFNHGFNNNQVRNSTFYANNNQGAPCIELRPVAGAFTNNAFNSVTGQNCGGGFIHVYGQSGGGIYNSSNWDSPTNSVYRDTIRIGKTASSYATNGYSVVGAGAVEQSLGTAALMSGRHLIAVGAGTSNVSTSGNATQPTNTNLTY